MKIAAPIIFEYVYIDVYINESDKDKIPYQLFTCGLNPVVASFYGIISLATIYILDIIKLLI